MMQENLPCAKKIVSGIPARFWFRALLAHWKRDRRKPIAACRESSMRASVNRPPTPDGDDEKGAEPTLQEIINIKLVESGEKEKLKELLRERLFECGWKDEMKGHCRAFTRKRGRTDVTLDELIRTITPKGRSSVPDTVKAELLQRIRSFLLSAAL
ncbi:hypothetical protein GOP47_0016565 [Adiantum capillus-veneris]|uniref:Transcription and mRNA export factor ENY2 n=1 Tax=Adiantum capillus-veneris TaxID=13818 RepID=A0A9D4UI22_ADICA|nr:hypothetical protein GOP47_0016565 [Adiantum capillus-veneris]